MNQGVTRVLAINPGSRYLGLAVFYGPDLREWCIKTTGREGGTKRHEVIRAAIEKIIERYGIDSVAMKRPHASRSSPFLEVIKKQTQQVGAKQNLLMSEYSIQEMKNFFDPYKTKNKRQLMEEVAIRYPDLYIELEREKKHKNPYRIRMFEAIALGIVHVHHIDSGTKKVGRNIH